MSGVWRRVVGVVCVVVLVGAAFWAGRVSLRRAPVPVVASSVVVGVTGQTVGQSLSYNATVQRPASAVAVNVLAGVVTRVSGSGTFREGGVLYAVAGVPVRVVSGGVPFYRPIRKGVTGQDVGQVRRALHALGYLADGSGLVWDAPAMQAMKVWQKVLGIPATGEVALGELVAVPRLPAVLLVDASKARVGMVLAGGEVIVSSSTGEPVFTMELTQDQAALVPSSARMVVHGDGHDWPAVITDSQQNASGNTVLTLRSPAGGVVCGGQCGSIPAASTAYLPTDIAVIPPTSGPGVPVSAIVTAADGSTSVLVVPASGVPVRRTVRVLASQDGVAIVSGVRVGEKVQALSGSTTAPDATSSSAPSGAAPSGAASSSSSTAGSPSASASR